MRKALSGKVCIVTGASGGIGRAIALKLSELGGYIVAGYGSNQEAAESLVREIADNGGRAVAVHVDLTSEKSVRQFFAEASAVENHVDILINNAGLPGTGPILETSMEAYRKVMQVNTDAVFLLTQLGLDKLGKGGRIINISSVLADRPVAGSASYAMSKAAIDALTKAAAQEAGERQISVNSVLPGPTEPGMFARHDEERKKEIAQRSPFKRIGKAEEVAELVAFLSTDKAGWITGQTITADGGTFL